MAKSNSIIITNLIPAKHVRNRRIFPRECIRGGMVTAGLWSDGWRIAIGAARGRTEGGD